MLKSLLHSTSRHSISADCALLPAWQRLWRLLNHANNSLFPRWAPGLDIRRFDPPTSGSGWDAAFGPKSPGRILCDLFWAHLDWNALRTLVGRLRLLDLGCGTGRYGERIERWSGEPLAAYVGVDVQQADSWRELTERHANFSFRKESTTSFRPAPDDRFTLIISQSAMEHFPRDRALMRRLARWQRACGRPVAHVHLLPAAACLSLFQYHGVRQYTPRTCRLLALPFLAWTDATLFALGGPACTALHRWWLDHARETSAEHDGQYASRLRDAIAEDRDSNAIDATFYALQILSV